MTQFSFPWECTETGDGGADSFSLDVVEVTNRIRTTLNPRTDGVIYWKDTTVLPFTDFSNPSTGLMLSSNPSGNTVFINSGLAIVQGWLFASDQTESFDTTGAANATDLIVLRRDASAQTVRLALKQAGAGGTATVTQSAATWEIPIATIALDGSGNLSTLTDSRGLAKPPVGSMTVIHELTADGTDPDFDIATISSLFKHLVIIGSVRSAIVSTEVDMFLRFNNDNGANYTHIATETTGAAVGSVASVTDSGINIGTINGSTALANAFSPIRIVIPDYADTTNATSCLFHCTSDRDGSINATGVMSVNGGGTYTTAGAVNRITLITPLVNIASGSTITLYGIASGVAPT